MSAQGYVPVVIAVTGSDSTAPPKTPAQARWDRFVAGIAIVLPTFLTFIIDPLVAYFSNQAIVLPEEYAVYKPIIAIVLSGAVAMYQAWRKGMKEQDRVTAARDLGIADEDGSPSRRARVAVASIQRQNAPTRPTQWGIEKGNPPA